MHAEDEALFDYSGCSLSASRHTCFCPSLTFLLHSVLCWKSDCQWTDAINHLFWRMIDSSRSHHYPKISADTEQIQHLIGPPEHYVSITALVYSSTIQPWLKCKVKCYVSMLSPVKFYCSENSWAMKHNHVQR